MSAEYFEKVINSIINGSSEDAIEFFRNLRVLKRTTFCKYCRSDMKQVSKSSIKDKYVFKCSNVNGSKRDTTICLQVDSFLKDLDRY